MTHFRNRNDIMKWLEKHARYSIIRRAMQEGSTELLGLFSKMPGFEHEVVIIMVKSKRHSTWYVVIRPDKVLPNKMISYTVNRVPWEDWIGDASQEFSGDHPEEYAKLRDKEIKEHESKDEGPD